MGLIFNKRDFVRLPFITGKPCRLVSTDLQKFSADLMDLSASGVRIELRTKLSMGMIYWMESELEFDGKRKLQSPVRVVHEEKIKEDYSYGCLLITDAGETSYPILSEDDQTAIVRYINKILIERNRVLQK
jgi:hypothetical protein